MNCVLLVVSEQCVCIQDVYPLRMKYFWTTAGFILNGFASRCVPDQLYKQRER